IELTPGATPRGSSDAEEEGGGPQPARPAGQPRTARPGGPRRAQARPRPVRLHPPGDHRAAAAGRRDAARSGPEARGGAGAAQAQAATRPAQEGEGPVKTTRTRKSARPPRSLMVVEIKAVVRYRDGYRCVECGMTARQHQRRYGRGLEVH